MFILQLLTLQTCQSPQTHVHNGLGLYIGKLKALHEPFFGNLGILTAADNGYHFVYEIQGFQESL